MAVSETERIIMTLIYAITMLVALLGNIFLIYIVRTKSEVRSLTSFMFVNMAVADLLVTLFMMPVSISQLYTDGKWVTTGVVGEITCRAIFLISFTTVMASILCLAFMAIDRFYAVVYPLDTHSLWFRKAKFVAPLVWIISMAFMSVVAIIYYVHDPSSICGLDTFGDQTRTIRGFYLYIFVITYLIPLVVISTLYAKAAHKIWFHEAPGDALSQNQQQQQITKRRVVRMLIIVVVVFALCWLPTQSLHLLFAIKVYTVFPPEIVMYLMFWIGHANSAVNPWLYIGLSSKIRSAFTRMVSRKSSGGSLASIKTTRSTKAGTKKDSVESRV